MDAEPLIRNDIIEEGDLAALVCIDDGAVQSIVFDQLRQLQFGIHTAFSGEEVSTKLRSRIYDIVIVSERFANCDAPTNSALAEIAAMPLETRRETYIVLIGPNMNTRSEMQAFLFSVDMVIRVEDAFQLKTIAGKGIVRQEEFYSVFNSVLRAVRAA